MRFCRKVLTNGFVENVTRKIFKIEGLHLPERIQPRSVRVVTSFRDSSAKPFCSQLDFRLEFGQSGNDDVVFTGYGLPDQSTLGFFPKGLQQRTAVDVDHKS